jgi:hypothetical protein
VYVDSGLFWALYTLCILRLGVLLYDLEFTVITGYGFIGFKLSKRLEMEFDIGFIGRSVRIKEMDWCRVGRYDLDDFGVHVHDMLLERVRVESHVLRRPRLVILARVAGVAYEEMVALLTNEENVCLTDRRG